MVHSDSKDNKESLQKQLRVVFRPTDKQHAATLDIPEELHSLKPSQLHNSIRVDRSGKTPRLVAKNK